MPRLAPFSAPRDRRAPSLPAEPRPTPFVPSWMRDLAASSPPRAVASLLDDAPIVPIDLLAADAPSAFAQDLDTSALSSMLAIPHAAEARGEGPAIPDATGTDALDAAAAEIESLARALSQGVRRPTPAQQRAIEDAARFGIDPALAERPEPTPLPAWGDDDFVDIMPTLPAAADRPVSDEAAQIAQQLTAVAERVRRGTLAVPAYTRGMGDAATLAATLAALLTSARA